MPRRRLLAGLVSIAAGMAMVVSAMVAGRGGPATAVDALHVSRRLTATTSWEWAAQLMSAIAIKLTSSIDDVVWLAPFMAVREKRRIVQHAGVYLCVCVFQAVLALAISRASTGALNAANHGHQSGWSSDKILTVTAGSALAVYGLYLTWEWYQETYGPSNGPCSQDTTDLGGASDVEQQDEEDEETTVLVDAKIKQHQTYVAEAVQYGVGNEKDPVAKGKKDKDSKNPQTLLIVAFLGSLDDLTLFIPMLAGKAMGWSQLLLGTFIAASAIVLICYFFTLCACVKDLIERVPLYVLVLFFSTVLLVKGLTMH